MKNLILICLSFLTFGLMAQTSGTQINVENETALKISHTADNDHGYALKLSTDRQNTKAVGVTNKSGEDLFVIWGNGVVNTKKLFAESITVKVDAMGTSWPDYVFEDGYQLPPLSEIEAFVQKHKHLPGVPSANQISEGYDVVEMDAALLQKVEELTLYVIELQKEIEAMKKAPQN